LVLSGILFLATILLYYWLREKERNLTELATLKNFFSTFHELSQSVLSRQDVETVLRTVREKATRLLKADGSVIFLLDENKQELLFQTGTDLTSPYLRDIAWRVIEERRLLTHNDLLEYGEKENFHSLLAIPLTARETVLGVFILFFQRHRSFAPLEIELANTLALSSSVAIENAMLFLKARAEHQELDETNRKLEVSLKEEARINKVLAILQELNAAMQSSLKLDEILETILKGMKEALGFRGVLLSLVDKSGMYLERKKATGIPKEELNRIWEEKPPIEYAQRLMQERFRISKSYFINHREAEEVVEKRYSYTDRTKPKILPLFPETWHPEDVLITPLYSKEGRLIGMISVDNPIDGKVPDERRIRILEAFANTAGLAIENARLYEEAERMISKLGALYEVGIAISSVLKLDDLLNEIIFILKNKLKQSSISLMLIEEGSQELVVSVSHGVLSEEKGFRLKLEKEGIARWVVETGEPLLIPDVRSDSRCIGSHSLPKSIIAVPLKREKKTIGVLSVEQEGAFSLDERDLKLFSTLATQIAIVIENARLYEKTAKQAITDGLTNIYNYRHFHTRLSEELKRSKRYHRPLSLIMLDIDHFKIYNDKHGHLKGDVLLRELAQLLIKVTRDVDLVARYGGEEFMIILPETSKREAKQMAERIWREVRENHFPYGETQPGGHLTISLGVATFPEDAWEKEELIDLVDQALYRAKQGGRDRVEI